MKAIPRPLNALFAPQSYKNTLYLVLTLPLGIAYFGFFVSGFMLSSVLSILGIGIPLLLFMFRMTSAALELERLLANTLICAGISPQNRNKPVRTGMLAKLKTYLPDTAMLQGLFYLLCIKLPLGILSFTIAISLIVSSATMLAAPLLYRTENFVIALFTIDTLAKAILCFVISPVMWWISIVILNEIAYGWRVLTQWILDSRN